MSSASRGLALRKVLECLLMKMGRTRPLVEPCPGPQAGKFGYPRSQDANRRFQMSSPKGVKNRLYTTDT